ncbi:MAG TPA: FkbM family methyltransferase [Hyphomicrobiaceae bacterium]|nr:FkbM family methyltransferase [Hyphomicrobiaceae bacterium]
MPAIADIARFFASHPLTRDAPLGAWARFLSWQVRSRLRDEIIVPWIGGQKLAVRRGMTGATGNVYAGLHEFADMMLVLHVLQPGDLFLDIGANVGSYTVLAAGVREATTWAFEPDADTVRALRRNIDLNGLGSRVIVHETALGECDGAVPFTFGMDTMNRVAGDGDANVRTVPVRRLDGLIGSAKPLMIKMDVEGYEPSVVRGAQGLLAQNGLKVVALETLSEEIVTMLSRHGFQRAYYDPFHRALSTAPSGPPASNAVFVKDWDCVTGRLRGAPAISLLGKKI